MVKSNIGGQGNTLHQQYAMARMRREGRIVDKRYNLPHYTGDMQELSISGGEQKDNSSPDYVLGSCEGQMLVYRHYVIKIA